MKKLLGLLLAILSISIVFTSCKKDEVKDEVSIIEIHVHYEYVPLKLPQNDAEVDALRIKEGNSSEWKVITHIEGFEFREGFEYELKVEKRKLANPPADGSDTTYKLIEIISAVAL